jgi:hypothetical protein
MQSMSKSADQEIQKRRRAILSQGPCWGDHSNCAVITMAGLGLALIGRSGQRRDIPAASLAVMTRPGLLHLGNRSPINDRERKTAVLPYCGSCLQNMTERICRTHLSKLNSLFKLKWLWQASHNYCQQSQCHTKT